MIRELPKELRPREKLGRYGVQALSNTEILAILIGNGTSKQSALELAKQVLLLEKQGISGFSSYVPEEFCKVSGIGYAKACKLVSAIELGRRISGVIPTDRIRIECPDTIASIFMEELRCLKKEIFRVVLLNVKNEIIGIEDISIGSLNASLAHPREVFRNAIKKSANSMILIHNNQSGDPSPSNDDLETTNRLARAGKLLGIEVLDHLGIGNGNFIS